MPRRRPWKVASEAVAIDHLSGGRLILGVDLGDTSLDVSFTNFGEVVDARQRALRFDSSCMYKHTYGGPWEDWTPADVRTLRTMADHERGTGAALDIALGGRQRQADWDAERALIKSIAGATWWVEYVPPEIGGPAEFRAVVQRGPLRID